MKFRIPPDQIQRFNERLGRELTAHEYVVLEVLDASNGVHQKHIADLLKITRSTLCPRVALMKSRGLVQVRRGREDRRLTLVYLMPRGRDLLWRARKIMTEIRRADGVAA